VRRKFHQQWRQEKVAARRGGVPGCSNPSGGLARAGGRQDCGRISAQPFLEFWSELTSLPTGWREYFVIKGRRGRELRKGRVSDVFAIRNKLRSDSSNRVTLMEGDATTSGSEPQHFRAQVPAIRETPDAGRTGNGSSAVENNADSALEIPWWFLGTV